MIQEKRREVCLISYVQIWRVPSPLLSERPSHMLRISSIIIIVRPFTNNLLQRSRFNRLCKQQCIVVALAGPFTKLLPTDMTTAAAANAMSTFTDT